MGPLVIDDDGPSMHFLDPGGAAIDVFLPAKPPGGGLLYHVANIGTGTLTVRDDGGVLIATVVAGATGIFLCSALEWSVILTVGAVVAPVGAPYLVVVNDANLTGERALVAGGGLTSADGGPDGAFTINVGGSTSIVVGADDVQRAALVGDVTAPLNSNTTTIANDAVTSAKILNDSVITAKILNDNVTYAKIQNVSATDRILGRDTAGAGDIEELTVSGGLEFTGGPGIQRSALTGDVTASAGSNSTTVVAASDTVAGKVELATDAEVQARTSTTLAITPAGWASASREALTANRTYFVRTDGSNSNTGLVDSAGGAFLTIQKAVDVAATKDLNGFTLTVQVRDGTYAASVTLKNVVGFTTPGDLTIVGNITTPTNVVLQGQVFATNLNSAWRITAMRIGGAGAQACLNITNADVEFGTIDFGTCTQAQIWLRNGGAVSCYTFAYTISAGSGYHIRLEQQGIVVISGSTITLTGTPAFTSAFAGAGIVGGGSTIQAHLITFSGAATGPRYGVSNNAVIYTGGGGANYFPGNSAGSASAGGLYL